MKDFQSKLGRSLQLTEFEGAALAGEGRGLLGVAVLITRMHAMHSENQPYPGQAYFELRGAGGIKSPPPPPPK